jgi:hypothetical protein
VQQYPIPYVARAGDTLVLGLGGIQRNAYGNQNLQTTDIQVTLTDHAGQQFVLEPNATFKAFPEYASLVNSYAVKSNYSLHPFDGGWFLDVSLVSWDEASYGEPLSLAPGAGTLSIVSSQLSNTALAGYDGDLTNIPIEILPGVADTNIASSYTNQLAAYTKEGGLPLISPDNLSGVSSVGGLQLAITYPRAAEYLDENTPPMVVPSGHNPYVQIAQNIVVNSNGTNTINVLLTAQKGFSSAANKTPFTPLLSDLSVQIMYFPKDERPSAAQLLSDFQIGSGTYVDLNGGAMAIHPVMTVQP